MLVSRKQLLSLATLLTVVAATLAMMATPAVGEEAAYQVLTQSQVGGTAYDHVDLSRTGRVLCRPCADTSGHSVTVPFDTTLYGTTSDNLQVMVDGYALFGPDAAGDGTAGNGPLPHAGQSLALMPFWDDHHGGAIYTQTLGVAPTRQFVVQWQVYPWNEASALDFSLVLTEGSTDVLFLYSDVDSGGPSAGGADATVGINKDGASAVQFSHNTQSLIGDLALGFTLADAVGVTAPSMPADSTLPDAHGYRAFTGANAPDFQYVDAAASGRVLCSPCGDTAAFDVTAPFDITFYGTTSRQLRAMTDGYLLVDNTTASSASSAQQLPLATHPLAVIPFWDDLGGGGAMYTQTAGVAPNRQFIVQWKINRWATGVIDFEVVFTEGSTDVLVLYKDTTTGSADSNDGKNAVVGINKDGATRLEWSNRTASLHDNMVLAYSLAAAPEVSAPSNVVLSDAFGYQQHTSNQAGGPVFDYVDVSTEGTVLCTACGDYASHTVEAPFDISLYGRTSRTLRVLVDGYLMLGNDTASSTGSPTAFPSAQHPYTVAAFWDDLGGGGDMFTHTIGTAPHRRFVVQWKVNRWAGGPLDFEVVFTEGSPDVLLQYADVTAGTSADNGAYAGVGMNRDAEYRFQYSYREPVLSAGLAILYTRSLVSTTLPQRVYPGRSAALTSVVYNNSEIAFPGSRVDLELAGPAGLTAADLTLESYDATSDAWQDVTLEDGDGVLTGTVGPPAGFPLAAGQKVTVPLRLTPDAAAPLGDLTVRSQLVQVGGAGDITGYIDDDRSLTSIVAFVDADGDDVADGDDNCTAVANANQQDLDSDGQGDVCDNDADGDGAPNDDDAFPLDSSETADADGDSEGDNADADDNDGPTGDVDGDLTVNSTDNCPAIGNGSQDDLNDDGEGDACDADIDGDGVANATDSFPLNAGEWLDTDGDNIGNNTDTDDDNDQVLDSTDKCDLVREDRDRVQDSDGCPDKAVTSTVTAKLAAAVSKIKGSVATAPSTAGCKSGRSVQLYKQRRGDDAKIGTPVTTAADGTYAAATKGTTGTLYTKVTEKKFGPSATGVVTTCSPATSPEVKVK